MTPVHPDPVRPLIVGNWKMNSADSASAAALAQAVAAAHAPHAAAVDAAVCPPAVWLGAVAGALGAENATKLGAQDCHVAASGAHTGDCSAPMLAAAGCRLVILGHSERRAAYGETDDAVRAKAEAAIAAGLTAIVCVGESLAERDAGEADAVVAASVAAATPIDAPAGSVVVAYEPIWAIGAGRTPRPAEVAAVSGAIRKALAGRPFAHGLRLLYGGSANAENAGGFFRYGDVDGALVGGASLKPDAFGGVIAAAAAP